MMKSDRKNKFLFFFIGAMTMFIALFVINSGNFKAFMPFGESGESTGTSTTQAREPQTQQQESNLEDIRELTKANRVVAYIKSNGSLPSYYITKSQAKKKGWIASEGNLCEVLPGKAIGGDIFGNRERRLPIENTYREADVNYGCGNRGSDRIVFTKNGEVWLSKDHYRTFQKQ